MNNKKFNSYKINVLRVFVFKRVKDSMMDFVMCTISSNKNALIIFNFVMHKIRHLITNAYDRKCAISGERTLPVLDAAHIKPYDQSGPHAISNGLLLRSDIHKLFDKGYMTVTNDYKIEVSNRIKQEFENGREYYKYHGNSLLILPNRMIDKPSSQFIEWHNQNIFKE